MSQEQRLPEPYFQDEQVTLYNADCREILPLLGPVDLVLTDPPYGETALEWDLHVDGWLPLLKTQQLWCCGSLRFFLESPFTGWRHVQEIIWEKHNGSSFRADRFRRVHEYVVHFVREGVLWGDCYHSPVYEFNGIDKHTTGRRGQTPHLRKSTPQRTVGDDKRLMRSVLMLPSMNQQAVHPTQKPVTLFLPLIEYSCPPGGIILDPFMGSGTGGVACKNLGRRFIGIDILETNCAIAVDRLRQSILPFLPKQPVTPTPQPTLFTDP